MKVFFVKYNDPIYVKLEKLDIMIRLASQANIAQASKQSMWCGAQALLSRQFPLLAVSVGQVG
jgi:vesicle coat complex subunit